MMGIVLDFALRGGSSLKFRLEWSCGLGAPVVTVAAAKRIQNAISNFDEIHNSTRGLFVLALQQVVDSFIADLLTDEAFEWLAEEQRRREP